MAKIVRLTESDLNRLVKKIIKEQPEEFSFDDDDGERDDVFRTWFNNDTSNWYKKNKEEGNKSDFKKYEKIIDNYSNELDDDDRDDENLSEIFKELEELQEKIYKNSELSKKEIKKLDDEIENLMDYITDVIDSY